VVAHTNDGRPIISLTLGRFTGYPTRTIWRGCMSAQSGIAERATSIDDFCPSLLHLLGISAVNFANISGALASNYPMSY
jgi:hypothetical protein